MNVLITGATGAVGSRVVYELQRRGVAVRAFVRDRDKAMRMLGEATALVAGDFSDRSSVEGALRGADAVFLACGNVPDQVAYERSAIDAARAVGVSRIIKLSGPRADVNSPLVFERWHGEIEHHLMASGVPWTMLRPSAYMTNVIGFADAIKHTGKLLAPAGAARIAYVDPRDVAAAAASVLATQGHDGNVYELTGPAAITYQHIAQELSAAIGQAIQYVDVPDEVAEHGMLQAGLPPMLADAIVAVFASYRRGDQEGVTDTVERLTGRPPRHFAEFAHDYAAVFAPSNGGTGQAMDQPMDVMKGTAEAGHVAR
jgi:uncharacterized protein YbjT (DUF2867 family)